jgi:signal transduction histidine kinase
VPEHQTILVFFVYGLSFFVLGLAVLIYPKKNSIFSLATHVDLIAWFGLTHGLNEWLDMFILICEQQDTYYLQLIRAIMLPGSFLFLVLFGVRSIAESRPKYSLLKLLPAILMFIWAAVVIVNKSRFTVGDIYARYLICLPGTILTSCALSLHLSQVKKTRLRAVIANMRFMVVVFFVYGLLSGAIVPKAWFAPASFLNYDLVLETLGFPVQILRAACATLLVYAMLRVLSIFHWETQSHLREGELRLTTVASTAPVILFKHDRRGILTGLEGRGLDSMNLNPARLIGKHISDLFPDFDFTKVCSGSQASGQTHNCDVTTADRTFHLCCSPIYAEDGRASAYVGAALDITQRLQAQAEIDQYRNELARARRLTELGTMSRALAKELRKPLDVAALLVQRLVTELDGVADSDKSAKALKKSLAKINDASSMVKKLCAYAQLPQADRPEPIDLQELFTRVMTALSERANQAGLDVIIDVSDATPCLAIAERELTYVFSAFIENAIAAASSNGGQKLTVTCETHDDSIKLIFTNTCCGSPKAELGEIFDPFSTTDSRGSAGMGLAIVKEIVQSNGGIITVDSRQGEGATFCLTLQTID